MSLTWILRLLVDAEKLRTAAREITDLAHDVARNTEPAVVHGTHGFGHVVGVQDDGRLEVQFEGLGYTVALPVDAVTARIG